MTKLVKSFLLTLITSILIVLFPLNSYSQYRSIDDEKYMKKQKQRHYRPSPEERRVMKIEKQQEKKKEKQKKKDERLHKKAVRLHNKKINGGGKDLVDGKRTYKRMKKSKREAMKNNK